MISPAGHDLFRDVLGKRTVLLATHINPDGDAIGSQVGLAEYLRQSGVGVRTINHDPTPDFLRFLEDPALPAEVYDPARHDGDLSQAETIVLLDNSAPDRLGRMEPVMRACAGRVLCIDHHPTRGTPWAQNILAEGASATSALVYELITHDGWKPNSRAAQGLYVGLATDTGFFRFNSTTPEAHAIASELLKAGADPALCYQEIYERNPPAHTRLLGEALSGLALRANGAVASIRITQGMVDRAGADGVDTSEYDHGAARDRRRAHRAAVPRDGRRSRQGVAALEGRAGRPPPGLDVRRWGPSERLRDRAWRLAERRRGQDPARGGRAGRLAELTPCGGWESSFAAAAFTTGPTCRRRCSRWLRSRRGDCG